MSYFFGAPSHAGILVSHRNGAPFTVQYDSFDIDPYEAPLSCSEFMGEVTSEPTTTATTTKLTSLSSTTTQSGTATGQSTSTDTQEQKTDTGAGNSLVAATLWIFMFAVGNFM